MQPVRQQPRGSRGRATAKAKLAVAGANTTTWSISVPMYDHPHSYMVTAWAIDENGLVEQSRPTRTFCVRDQG